MSMRRTGVLFVCLGNICRSPLAKCVFADLAVRRGVAHLFDIDSCGTGHWHAGRPADPRSVATAGRFGLTLDHTARQLKPRADFERFEFLIAMDRANRDDLLGSGAAPERVHLMRSFGSGCHPDRLDVPDPYYGPGDGFEQVYHMLTESCQGLIERLLVQSA